MNILIEFLSANGRYGAGEYHRRVVKTLLSRIAQNKCAQVKIYALYDSRVPISFEDLRIEILENHGIAKYIDIYNCNLLDIIKIYNIDKFFIACSQRIGIYPEISKVNCEVICVTHDLLFEEWFTNNMYDYWANNNIIYGHSPKNDIKIFIWKVLQQLSIIKNILLKKNITLPGYKELSIMKSVIEMLKNNMNSQNIMVSEYSKATMVYNFGINPNKIQVLYSPERINVERQPVENTILKRVVGQKLKYFLMVSAARDSKNAIKAIRAFYQYSKKDKDMYFLIIGYPRDVKGKIIKLDFLSDSDLSVAMENCYALLYPSYFEGFGYPPLEAMKYGRPVLCSNSTSMPEILGDAPIYFSPLYESAIFKAMCDLSLDNYESRVLKSIVQYKKVSQRQNKDFDKLIDLILEN